MFKNQEDKKRYAKEYYLKNKDILKEKMKEYRDKNKEALREQKKIYTENNKEKCKESCRNSYHKYKKERIEDVKKYVEENKDKVSTRRKKHYIKNRERILSEKKIYNSTESAKLSNKNSTHKRRAIKKEGDLTTKQLLNLKKNSTHCAYCNCELEFDKKLAVHLDHIIPLSKGGTHTLSNVVFACQFCNISKGDRVI